MSAITSLLDRLFPPAQVRVLIVGGPISTGKTTALYQVKLGEVVTTIPTIGFNVESVQHQRTTFTFWDVGGRDKIRPLWRHYFQGTDAIIFTVHSGRDCFTEFAEDVREEISKLMAEDELRDAVLLVWANFQDLPDAIPPNEIAERLQLHQLRNRHWWIQGTVATTGEGLRESLGWLEKTLKESKKSKPSLATSGLSAVASVVAEKSGAVATAVASGVTAMGAGARAALSDTAAVHEVHGTVHDVHGNSVAAVQQETEASLLQWLEEETDEVAMLQRFASGELSPCGHKERIQLAWLLIQEHGRKEAIRLLFEGFRTILGASFHETTLYFWAHMVHYAMESTAKSSDFKSFLVMNPVLANSNLLLDYYTQEAVWQDPAAQTQVVMPDKRPLPSLLSDVSASKQHGKEGLLPAVHEVSDQEFLDLFLQRKPPAWGHETRLRAIWLLLRNEGRRQSGTTRIFEALRQAEGDMHNVTESYFWIQMVTYYTAMINEACFAAFARHNKCTDLLDPRIIFRHYSEAVLVRGVSEFQLPDQKPLPSIMK